MKLEEVPLPDPRLDALPRRMLSCAARRAHESGEAPGGSTVYRTQLLERLDARDPGGRSAPT
jgi:hypothetical protein